MMNLLSLAAGGVKTALAAAEELDLDLLSASESLTAPMWADWGGLTELLLRFFLNVAVISFIARVFYYPKSKRRDYFVTFILISISIFLIIYLMGGVKLKTGVALGLFAIFGIIRYRTESVPIREMTYLFLIIAVSTINALDSSISYIELLATNLLFIISLWVIESNRWVKHVDQCGGVQTDTDGQTSLRGLFCAGETGCTGLHGANRLASNSLLECVVISKRALNRMLLL